MSKIFFVTLISLNLINFLGYKNQDDSNQITQMRDDYSQHELHLQESRDFNESKYNSFELETTPSIYFSDIKNNYTKDIIFHVRSVSENDNLILFTYQKNFMCRVFIDKEDNNDECYTIVIKPFVKKGFVNFEYKFSEDNTEKIVKTYFEKYDGVYFFSEISEVDLQQKILTYKYKEKHINLYDYDSKLSDMFTHNGVYTREQVSRNSGPTNTLKGVIKWIDDFDYEHETSYIKVELWRKSFQNDNDTIIDSTFTLANGTFEFIFDSNVNNPCQDVYVKIFAESKATIVKTDSMPQAYYFVSSDICFQQGGVTNSVEFDFHMNCVFGQALQICQAVTYCAKYVSYLESIKTYNSDNNFVMPIVNVHYPVESNGASYSSISSTIKLPKIENVANEDNLYPYSSWDVISHEYGHHVANIFEISHSPGGNHGIMTNMSDFYLVNSNSPFYGNHEEAKENGVKIAWSEGWATYFGITAINHYINNTHELSNIYRSGDSVYNSYNGLKFNLSEYITLGEGCESTVSNFLYKLTEDNNMIDPYLPINKLWESITIVKPVIISQLVFELYSYTDRFYSFDDFGYFLEKFNLAPSNIEVVYGYDVNECPTIKWSIGCNGSTFFYNDTFSVIVTSRYGSFLFGLQDYRNNTYTLTEEQWNTIKAEYDGEFNIQIYGSATNYYATGFYVSGTYSSIKNGLTLSPENYGFTSNYIYYEELKLHDMGAFKLKTKRFRTGYIENEYIVLSPRKYDAGVAYLEYSTGFPIFNITIEMALWSEREYLSSIDSTAVISYRLRESDEWIDVIDLLEDGLLPTDRTNPTNISIAFPSDVYEFRIYAQTAKIGNHNKGRICIGKLEFNNN